MNGATLNFNATNVPTAQVYDAIPSGWQNAQIVASGIKPTSDGKGQYLNLELDILDGPYAGRKLYDRLNLVNNSEQAREIAYKTLSAICHATGVIQVGNSVELHNKPMKVKVKLRPASKNEATGKEYDANNEIAGYDHINSDHALEHTPRAGGVAGAPQGVPVWAAGGAPQPPQAAPMAAPATTPPGTPPALSAQPWAQPQAGTPVAPAAPAVPVAPTAPVDPLAAALADGWTAHPTSPGWYYRGQDVKLESDVRALYAAPAVPAAPAAPAAPTFAAPTAATPATGAANAPWLQQ